METIMFMFRVGAAQGVGLWELEKGNDHEFMDRAVHHSADCLA